MKKKVSIITLGCKVNQYESNAIGRELEDAGFLVSHGLESADIYVINTCAVTNEAEKKSRGIVAKIKKLTENAPIYICGCSSQNDPNKFTVYPNVKAVYGTSSKQNIAKHIIENNLNEIVVYNDISKNYQDQNLSKGDRTRVVIKIQEGCNNFCSYCLIPYLRGRERSRSMESIIKELDIQTKHCKEVIFTGINLSNYGKEFNNGTSLASVAELMSMRYPFVRFRFSSLEQDVITDDFLKVLKNAKNFAPHFHLSLQSGCDNTLKFMNRKYKSSEYYHKIELIRKYFDNPAITTDVIVGFPTETDQDFIDTYNFVKNCAFAKMHIFPYSKRSGTVAAKMKNIATNVKERVKALSELDKSMHLNYVISCQNKEYTAIVETCSDEYFEAHTENYIKCYIEKQENLEQNQEIKVKILKPFKDGATCKIMK